MAELTWFPGHDCRGTRFPSDANPGGHGFRGARGLRMRFPADGLPVDAFPMGAASGVAPVVPSPRCRFARGPAAKGFPQLRRIPSCVTIPQIPHPVSDSRSCAGFYRGEAGKIMERTARLRQAHSPAGRAGTAPDGARRARTLRERTLRAHRSEFSAMGRTSGKWIAVPYKGDRPTSPISLAHPGIRADMSGAEIPAGKEPARKRYKLYLLPFRMCR